ncbi:unnamed protein product [Ectocarpus sp. CCAP 1310/34]|nr:unnamed protein product [Ectocarpus sp. CCAP 1310/34]
MRRVALTVTAVDDWGGDTREAMIELGHELLTKYVVSVSECSLAVGDRFHKFMRAEHSAKGAATPAVSPSHLITVSILSHAFIFARVCVVQAPGTWMVNDVSSREVEELMDAFEQMTTVVKFANTTLATENIAEAQRIYAGAMALFRKLGNDRGVSIMNNNLGNVYALQAGQFVAKARDDVNPAQTKALMEAAQDSVADAVTNHELAINDAEVLCAATNQQPNHASPLLRSAHRGGREGVDETECEEGVKSEGAALADADVNDDDDEEDDNKSHAALCQQLVNRKFILALCLTAKGNSTVATGGQPDLKTIDEARNLMQQCILLTHVGQHNGGKRNNGDAKTDLRRIGYLLQLSALEREQQDRSREAGEALDAAELVIAPYESFHFAGGLGAAMATPLETPVRILRQRLLEARAAHCVASGFHAAAIDHYTQAIIGTGDLIDPSVARASLLGLRSLASDGNYGRLSRAIGSVGLASWRGRGPRGHILGDRPRYRDFGDSVQYESFDFHKEYDLHKLTKKLEKIKAYGGQDFPEDVAGGLKLATELVWRGNIRLCILLADAPCHGNVHHTGAGDMFPNCCPMGNDPAKLLYKLQV